MVGFLFAFRWLTCGVTAIEHWDTNTVEDLTYTIADHLGSATMSLQPDGAVVSNVRYLPYGQERWTDVDAPTDKGFTGQRNETGFGLMDYNARYYSPSIMMWASPDTLIPDPYNPLDWNRYSYVRYNPINNTDPTGHKPCGAYCEGDWIDERTINTLGSDWDIKQQKENSAKVESVITGIVKTELAFASPFLFLGFQVINDEQVNGSNIALAFLPASGKIGKEIGSFTDDLHIIQAMEGHHIIPRQILKMLPEDLANAVRGAKGAPNIWPIPKSLHKTIHSGLGNGGYYNALWRRAIEPLIARGDVTPQEIFAIRDQLVNAFSLWQWKP